MKDIGLVFSGGGVKGAYEIGVWKYLKETGLDSRIGAVSGTSVGALNAALFVGSTYEEAERIWKGIKQTDVTTPPNKKKLLKDYILLMAAFELKDLVTPQPTYVRSIRTAVKISKAPVDMLLYRYICDRLYSDGFCLRNKMQSIIDKSVNFNRLKSGNIPCFATCLRILGYKKERFNICEAKDVKELSAILLASSAIPIVFPKEKIGHHYYYDGGLPVIGDNTPIKPIYDLKYKKIIVVYLNNKISLDVNKYPNSEIVEITPSCGLGNILTVKKELIEKRIDLGYNDAKKNIKW